jgi:hypothetical protein
VSVILGNGSGNASEFECIPWEQGNLFLKLEVDPSGGSNYTPLGTSMLQAVPYALYAQKASEFVSPGTGSDDDPIFVVRNNLGQIVFAVYQTGVRVFVEDTGSKSTRGGFAVGGLSSQNKQEVEYLRVTPDSVRVNVLTPNAGGKNLRGGFAVGGLSGQNKALPSDLLYIAPEMARIYVDNSTSKSSRGGFAVGGFSGQNKAEESSFLYLTAENYFIGQGAGKSITIGKFNSFVGFEAGYNTTEGSYNAFLGYKSGFNNTLGLGNLFLGYWSGYNNSTGSFNTFVGYTAGSNNTTGGENTFIGSYTGSSNTEGSLNSFLGYYTGYNNLNGQANSFFGNYSGFSNTYGSSNVFLGNKAGYKNVGGGSNVYIGDRAGYNNTYGISNVYIGDFAGFNANNDWANVFIGYQSGYSTTVGNSNVFIGNAAGRLTTWGSQNVYIGDGAGEKNTTGSYNVAIGVAAGQKSSANDNVFIGYGTGYVNTTGSSNVFLGNQAGWNNSSGASNIYIGSQSGYANTTGFGNIFIGLQAGYNETGSQKLYIDNTNTSSPLIYGDFSSNYLKVNGTIEVTGISTLSRTQIDAQSIEINATGAGNRYAYLDFHGDDTYSDFGLRLIRSNSGANATSQVIHRGTGELAIISQEAGTIGLYTSNSIRLRITSGGLIGLARTPTTNRLEVNGDASKSTAGDWLANSDRRIKTQIADISNARETILRLRPVSFRYSKEWLSKNPEIEDKVYYNFIAQEYIDVFPQSVKGSGEFLEGQPDEILQIDSYNAQIVSIKAVQELIIENKNLHKEIESLKAEILTIKALLNR